MRDELPDKRTEFEKMKVSVVEYRPEWRTIFEEEKQLLQAVLDEISAQIEHIGSTAVTGLAAKPIIDIMIGLPDFSAAGKIVPEIEALGYDYFKKYEDEMPYRRYFAKNRNGIRTHQIHMVETGSEFWARHLFFRDYLRQYPETAERYAALKKRLAEREWADVNEYADAKTEFIKRIENKAKERAAEVKTPVNAEPVINEYLNSLTVRVKQTLEDNLIGLYVSDSLALNDFHERSDIDVIAVSAKSPSRGVKEKLAREISHGNFNCPAAGLDFILADFDCASSAPVIQTFEFAVSTGEKWETEIEYGGVYDELPFDFAICRKYGQTLYGPAPAEVFAAVPDERLNGILRKIIGWHRKHIFHPFHDPLGHYAVLNACRAWRFAEEKVLCSKTGGGEWLLAREPAQQVVKDALDIRLGKYNQKLDRISVERFLDAAEAAFVMPDIMIKPMLNK